MVSRSDGFTLVELLVAATVLAVGVLALLGVTANANRLVSSGDRVATAAFYAQQRLEALQARDCATLAPGAETQADVYDLEWTITPAFGGDAQRVQVLVSYPSHGGSLREDTLETSVLCIR